VVAGQLAQLLLDLGEGGARSGCAEDDEGADSGGSTGKGGLAGVARPRRVGADSGPDRRRSRRAEVADALAFGPTSRW